MRRSILLPAAALLAAGLQVAPAAADVTIGMATALTGKIAAIGEQSRRGAEAAIATINAKGGVLGQKLALAVSDDACDPKQAVSVANQMVSAKTGLVLGHLCSGAAIAASGIYAESGVLMITASATNPALTERRLKAVFRACGRDDQQGAVAGAMLAEGFAAKKIALVHDKSAYGKGLVDQAAATLARRGVRPAHSSAITAGEHDFSALVSRLKREAIEVVYFGGYHAELGLIVRQARAQGLSATFVGGEAMSTEEFWKITGAAGNGTLFTYAPEVKSQPAAAEALAAIRAAGGEPDNFAFYHYAAVQALAQAIERAGSATPAAVAAALRNGSFETVVGTMAFDANGDLKAPAFVFFEWRDGRHAPI